MKKFVLTSVAACALSLMAVPQAKAVVVSTTLGIHPSSFINIQLIALAGSVSADVNLNASGTIDITADNVGLDALALAIDAADINLSDGSLDLQLGVLGGVLAQTFGLGVSATSGALTPLGGNQFDAGGTTLALDQGLITYEGTGYVGTLLPPGTFDFVGSPLSLAVPGGSATVTLLEAPKDATTNNVTLLIPLSVSQSIVTSPIDVDATLTALIIATGMKLTDNGGPIIPEPSSWLLIGLGLMSVVPMIRRRLRR